MRLIETFNSFPVASENPSSPKAVDNTGDFQFFPSCIVRNHFVQVLKKYNILSILSQLHLVIEAKNFKRLPGFQFFPSCIKMAKPVLQVLVKAFNSFPVASSCFHFFVQAP
ncbi:MAG: hypothetical protein N3E41_08615 [Thermofilaceae archaeon]|nr:hypothetical protein [Thermofilaceae archaeon]